MNRVAGIVLAILLCCPMWAVGEEKPRLITVSGEAEVLVVPDEVILTLGVETSDMQLELAKDDNDLRIKRIIATAKRHGVKKQYIKTDYLHIEPRYQYRNENRNFLGYFVRKTVVVTLRDISKFEGLLSDALQQGTTHVHGIQFKTTELRKHRDQARSDAIVAAREKATDLAAELNQKIGRPQSINAHGIRWWGGQGTAVWGQLSASTWQNSSIVAAQSAGQRSSIAAGQLKVTASVTVSFQLLDE